MLSFSQIDISGRHTTIRSCTREKKTRHQIKYQAHLQGTGKKRVFPLLFQTDGVLSVEAAFLLPLFLFAMLTVLSVCQILHANLLILGPLHETGRRLAREMYVSEAIRQGGSLEDELSNQLLSHTISVAVARERVVAQLKEEELLHAGVVNGAEGLSFLFSNVPDENDVIDLVVSYRLRLPFQFVRVPDLVMAQRCRVHGWVGYQPEADESERLVYVTENGTVYHLFLSCSHLKLSIQMVSLSEMPQLRNRYGANYYPCETCGKTCGGIVYITDTGTRYHSTISCSGLKRSIKTVPLEQVKDLPLCKTCGGNR